MKILALFLFLGAIACVLSCATMESGENIRKAEAHYKMGFANLNENKIQQAFVEFHKAYELDPNNKEVLNAIGLLYLLHLDDPAKAITYFERAVKIDPLFSEGYNNLGYSYEKTGNFETAITFYRKALSNPVYQTADKAYFNTGNSLYRMGKYEEALTAYKEALRRNPDLGLAYRKISLCYNAMGRYGDASTAMTEAIKRDTVYKGDREKALEDLSIRKMKAIGYDEQDIRDYIEILKY